MRSARWAAVAAAIAFGVLSGCSGIDTTISPVEEGADARTAESTVAESTSAAPTSKEPKAPPSAEPDPPAPDPEPGTRENPGVVGSDVGTFSSGQDSIEVTVEAATWDANEIVAGENPFNDPPADGMVYVIVPLTVTYSGPDSMLPWLDVDVTYLAPNGRSYEQAYAVIPDDLRDVADIYDGGSATGNIIFELPADQVPDGLWGVSYNWSDPLWWAAS